VSKQDFNARNILRIHWQSPPSPPTYRPGKRKKKTMFYSAVFSILKNPLKILSEIHPDISYSSPSLSSLPP
jgi:hypothetical protein